MYIHISIPQIKVVIIDGLEATNSGFQLTGLKYRATENSIFGLKKYWSILEIILTTFQSLKRSYIINNIKIHSK